MLRVDVGVLKLLRRSVLFGLVLAATTPGSGAPAAAEPTLHRTASAYDPAVTAGAGGGYAYLASETVLQVRGASGRSLNFSVASGCEPEAMTTTAVAFICVTSTTRDLVTLSIPDGRLALLPAPEGRVWEHVVSIGERWAIATTRTTDDGKVTFSRAAVDRRSAAHIELGRDAPAGVGDPFGAGRWLDPDVAALGVALCSPVRRRTVDLYGDLTPFLPVAKVGPWVLQVLEDRGSPSYLQRCDSSKAKTYEAPSALTRGAFAFVDGPKVVLVDLRSAGRRTIRVPEGRRGARVGFSGRRLIVSVLRASRAPREAPFDIYELR